MNAIENKHYRPALAEKTRVRLLKAEHHEYLKPATILWALPNPSGRPEHQWYDVRFDDGLYGRFLEAYLERIADSEAKEEGVKGGQVFAA
jgi:hypothetical protein